MSRWFYSKLAKNNIKKNARTYLPYILTCIGMVAMFYIICSLSKNTGLEKMPGSGNLTMILSLGAWVTGIFSVIFLFYTNSFLMKRRKKELGLFNILGMEKRHISRVILCETLMIAAISLVVGILLGILLDKLMYLCLLAMFDAEIALGFEISLAALSKTCLLFLGIFLLILFKSIGQIHLSKPIELLKGGQVGEREPKTKILLAIAGLLCLSGGYYISIATKNPMAVIMLFFVAVILVIIGTYLLFTAGSIALLKLLRKNKGFYYKTNHFTAISGMMYRMKQNAVGLASICILSTAVLVMISSTLSMYIGMESMLERNYPRDIVITVENRNNLSKNHEDALAKAKEWIANVSEKTGQTPTNELIYTYLIFSGEVAGSEFSSLKDSDTEIDIEKLRNVIFIPLGDYNRLSSTNKTLAENEALIYSNRQKFGFNSMKIFDREFIFKETLSEFSGEGITSVDIVDSHIIVVKDIEIMQSLLQQQKAAASEIETSIGSYYAFDLNTTDEQIISFYETMFDMLHEGIEFEGRIDCSVYKRETFLSTYAGLFFIGIFLGIVFTMATILIIYYKQVSEGYDDKARFEIMQKVGMSKQEIKKSIHSQVLTVFFLPLIAAGIHIAFAFPLISRLLRMLNLTNTTLFIICTIGCFLVFAILYAIVYGITAKVYYKIVS